MLRFFVTLCVVALFGLAVAQNIRQQATSPVETTASALTQGVMVADCGPGTGSCCC